MKMFSSVMAETLSLEEFNSEQIIMPKRNIRLKNLLFAKSFGLASVFVILFSGAPNGNFRENICSEDELRSRIFGAFVVKFLACLPLLGFSNISKWYNYPFLTYFDPKKGHLEFSGAFSWLKFSRR